MPQTKGLRRINPMYVSNTSPENHQVSLSLVFRNGGNLSLSRVYRKEGDSNGPQFERLLCFTRPGGELGLLPAFFH